jgi:hypothetical protein
MQPIRTPISKSLYTLIIQEKKKLQEIENKKVKSRRTKITMIKASQSLARKL